MKFSSVNWARIGTVIYTRKYYVAGLIILLVVGGAVWRLASSEEALQTSENRREVSIARVADLMNGGASLSVIGEVESKSEAEIRTEAGGSITSVNVSLGSYVGAGHILAEIENSSQRAALLQAEGALDAAKASVPNIESSLEAAKGSVVSTLLSAYAAVENAIRDAADPLFSNPNASTPSFNVIVTTDSQARLALENTRSSFNSILGRHKARGASLSSASDISKELDATETEVRAARNFLDTLLKALNSAVASAEVSDDDLATFKAEATAARTSLTTSLSAITSARSALEVAKNNASGSGRVSSAEAQLKQAEGVYRAALANLEKTRIRAPLNGTITNFSIKLGDYVTPSQQVAVVANTSALEIVTDVTAEDRTRIVTGSTASIEGGFTGTVTKIAPALDPITRKIEVRIGLPAEAVRALVSGQSVRVEIARTTPASSKAAGALRIPLAALKMEAERALIFTVNNESKLIAQPVTIGALSGDYITVTEGLTADTEIVTDARGLKEGDIVAVGSKD
ncbi:hypothetical protein A3A38_00825 [Candidatus Kaiserbacteria bacterium RIFCSPLOWO2_01_FULL_53_17]|uniref:Uncharacterized protein n=1 Tax=Candidatus Kaiserbacteria bacterium RIFCSPLOWO2_01_FULL_53_17 TaxID=1798511 RepID=A0A1F6EGF0_9BACT|nr:MAG: hypothetical protein A3A38_00825 [Candidatus Kaiserbacteria bacterium RIFCSPLOWO2_01_FULL_53_17]